MSATAPHRAARGYFVTGTDTGVGKTLVACALLHALAAQGLRVTGMKPVAAGADRSGAHLVNDDVLALKAAGNVEVPIEALNPYCFEPAIAPHIAAKLAGREIELQRLADAHAALAALADCVIVEGAGGFAVPLGVDCDMSDLAALLAHPVIMVVGMRLGCLNHALLTAAAIRSKGLRLAGWVANQIDPHMPRPDENVDALIERLPAPLVARIPYATHPRAEDAAAYFDMLALA
jgi:dethiobiotin synthetase